MVLHNCDLCEYSSQHLTHYKKHIQTKKHISNMKIRDLEKSKNDVSIIMNLKIEELKEELKEELQVVKKETQIMKTETQQVKKETQLMKTETQLARKETQIIKEKQLETKGEIKNLVRYQNKINRSVMTVLSQNFSDNPPLTKIDKDEFIKELELEYKSKIYTKDFKLQQKIIKDYNNKRLINTIVDLILKFIKKEEITLQSIFNTDCSRGNYATKLETYWLNDKLGLKFRDIILRPVIEYMIDSLQPLKDEITRIIEINKKTPSIDKSDFIMNNSTAIMEINYMLVKKKTYDQIIYELSPKLHLDTTCLLLD